MLNMARKLNIYERSLDSLLSYEKLVVACGLIVGYRTINNIRMTLDHEYDTGSRRHKSWFISLLSSKIYIDLKNIDGLYKTLGRDFDLAKFKEKIKEEDVDYVINNLPSNLHKANLVNTLSFPIINTFCPFAKSEKTEYNSYIIKFLSKSFRDNEKLKKLMIIYFQDCLNFIFGDYNIELLDCSIVKDGNEDLLDELPNFLFKFNDKEVVGFLFSNLPENRFYKIINDEYVLIGNISSLMMLP